MIEKWKIKIFNQSFSLQGQYKFFGRFYTGENVTILQYEAVAIFRPNRANLLTDFAMG